MMIECGQQFSRRVLVADHEPSSRRAIVSMLEKIGYAVEVVNDGEAAWQRLQQEDAPQLVVLDGVMPGLAGGEVCRRIRALRREDYAYAYIIVLTPGSEVADVLAAYEAGVDDYMDKPLESQELRFRLRAGERVLALQEKLHFLATRDELTGLFNRRMMLDVMRTELARSRRNGEGFCLGLLDLDCFKQVNDAYGHLAGDAVLCEAAVRVRESVREYDTAGRWGGEAFVVVLSAADAAAGRVVLERIRERISEKMVDLDGVLVEVTVSIGGVVFSADKTIDQLIREADQALHRAKEAGRNRVCFYE